jgi:hypothetical protein
MTVGPVTGRVDVEDRLNVIFSGRDIPDAVDRKSERLFVDHSRRTRFQPFDIHPEKGLRRAPIDGCKPGFVLKIAGKEKEDAAVYRFLPETFQE